MCKTSSIRYACKHYWNARLSTCHGTFTVQPKPGKPPEPSCCSAPTFVMQSTNACGDCQRKRAEAELSASLDRARVHARKSGLSWSDAEQAYQDGCFKLYMSVPTCRQYRSREKPGKGRCGPRDRVRGSLLKREVLPEEVLEKHEGHKTALGWSWDKTTWGVFKTLAEELAEKAEDETPSPDLPTTSSTDESMDDYLSAFEEGEASSTSDKHDRSEQQDESSWSTAWSAEPADGQSWTSEESTYWNPEPEADVVAPTAMPFATSELLSQEEQKEDEQIEEPSWQAGTGRRNSVDVSSSFSPSISRPIQTLPTRSKRPPPHRRSTFDGERMEVELRDRFMCLQLPYLIPVGGN